MIVNIRGIIVSLCLVVAAIFICLGLKDEYEYQRIVIVIVCTVFVLMVAVTLFSMSFVSNGIAWFVLSICLMAVLLIIGICGVYTYYNMSIEKVRVQRIDQKIEILFGLEEDTKAQLMRTYVCCGKYNIQEFPKKKDKPEQRELPAYCCPKRYEACNETVVFRRGCFEAMLDWATHDELNFFIKNFVVYFILLTLAIAVAVAEAAYLRYRRY